jgi:tripartite-type tricarboxylate transporter receptor subunit TctC
MKDQDGADRRRARTRACDNAFASACAFALKSVSSALLVGLVCLSPAKAASPANFYAGKTLTVLVASDAGGGYDVYARLLAQYLGKYIPGSPSIVVQDEPGAGGLRAAQEIYSVVAKDGSEIGFLRGSNMLDSVLGIRGADIDPNRFAWIGNMAGDTDLCTFWYTSGVHSFADLLTKQVLVGASGNGSQGFIFPNAINHILHTKMKIIAGYKGVGDRILALQQGELQGNCGMNASTITGIYSELIASGKLVPIMQSGLRPYPALPNVPLTQTYATDDTQRRILTTVSSQMEISRIFAAPPETPKDRVAILRTAFMQAAKDPGLAADAKRAKLDLAPSTGEEVARIVQVMSNLSAADKTEARTALGE